MDVFELRNQVIDQYGSYIKSFFDIRDDRISTFVSERFADGHLWPDPLIQLNPCFKPGEPLDQLIAEGLLHPETLNIFRVKDKEGSIGDPFRLHRHQVEAIRAYFDKRDPEFTDVS